MKKELRKTVYNVKNFGKNSMFFNIQKNILLIMIIPFVLISFIAGSYYSKSIRNKETRLSGEIYDSIALAFNSAVDETDSFRSLLISSPSSASIGVFFIKS